MKPEYNNNLIVIKIRINGRRMRALVDTGASHSYISKSAVKDFELETRQTKLMKIGLADGASTSTTTKVKTAKINIHNREVRSDLIVLNQMNPTYHVIVGMDIIQETQLSIDEILKSRKFKGIQQKEATLQHISLDDKEQLSSANESTKDKEVKEEEEEYIYLHGVEINPDWIWLYSDTDKDDTARINIALPTDGVVNAIYMDKASDELTKKQKQFIDKYKSLFPETPPDTLPPERRVKHEIKLIDETKIHARPPYRSSGRENEVCKETIEKLLKSKLIRPSKSPHSAPVIFAKKKDGTLRMCADYRDINRNTIPDNTPLPHIAESIDRVKGAKIFSKIDLDAAFWQVAMTEESKPKTAFGCRYGHYEYNVMPMGLRNSPATFTTLMNEIFVDLTDRGILVYLDDILIYSETEEEHRKLLTEVFERLKKHQLYPKLKKCEFFRSEIDFLGFTIDKNGKRPMSDKIHKALDFATPKNKKQLMQFIGLANYYRDHIDQFSIIASPMTDLLQKDRKFEWSDECQNRFEQMKEALSSAPVLRASDHKKPFYIHCDASDVGGGASLEQLDEDNKAYAVQFWSKKFNETERNYDTIKKETFIAKEALKHFRPHIHGAEVHLYTDNQPLVFMRTQRPPRSQYIRWQQEFDEYNITFHHKKGKDNVVADALSRSPEFYNNTVEMTIEPNELSKKIIHAQNHDELCIRLKYGKRINKSNLPKLPLNVKNDVVYQRDRLYIPKSERALIHEILIHYHDNQQHIGIDKTIEFIKRNYYWTNMDDDIKHWIINCIKCQRIKPNLNKPKGLLQSHSIPYKPWQVISVDFITDLPRSKSNNDSIVVFVDTFSKMTKMTALKKTDGAERFAQIFNDKIVSSYGHPHTIISDRDTRFTSKYWECLSKLLGIKLNRSSAYHPETDGQTERMNQTLENLLRAVVNEVNDNWEEQLPTVEYTMNNTINASTKLTPFDVCLTWKPQLAVEHRDWQLLKDEVPAATKSFDDIVITYDLVTQNIRKSQQKQQKQANKHRIDEKFKVGDKVMLSTANLKLPFGIRKLTARYFGPFEVIAVNNDVNYKLRLPSQWKVHNNIHISKLKKFNEDKEVFPDRQQLVEPPPTMVMEDGQTEYEVDRIIDHKTDTNGNPTKYLVLWKGYNAEDATFEPIEHLKNSSEAIAKYHQSLIDKQQQSLLNRDKNTRTTRAVSRAQSESQTLNAIDNNEEEAQQAEGRRWIKLKCCATCKNGNDCSKNTWKGDKCWIHTKLIDNLRIKPSNIKSAGYGLYVANKEFKKGAIIAEYLGEISRNTIYGTYVLEINRNTFINANKSTCLASFANSCRASNKNQCECKNNNAEFKQRNGKTVVIATRKIQPNEEIFINYGRDYWKYIDQFERDTEIAMKRSLTEADTNRFDRDTAIATQRSIEDERIRQQQQWQVKTSKKTRRLRRKTSNMNIFPRIDINHEFH